ncbi:MAG TPA: amino acid racemase [Burkholderiales bacterium]|nr:amino acid racemase [Burkholderiales bacterium]
MKTLGIIGGIAPGSTIDYYRLLVARYRDMQPDGSYPSVLINSIDLKRVLDLVNAGTLNELTEYLGAEVGKLARGGADVALLASNTPHLVFEDIQRHSPIPLISIVEAACSAAQAAELRKVGLFGTRFTMHGRFYPDVFSRRDITVIAPSLDEQDYIHERYLTELVHEIFKPETRDGMMAIARRMQERDGIEGLILGGTELPLLLRKSASPDFPFLDTTAIHVERALAACFQ